MSGINVTETTYKKNKEDDLLNQNYYSVVNLDGKTTSLGTVMFFGDDYLQTERQYLQIKTSLTVYFCF